MPLRESHRYAGDSFSIIGYGLVGIVGAEALGLRLGFQGIFLERTGVPQIVISGFGILVGLCRCAREDTIDSLSTVCAGKVEWGTPEMEKTLMRYTALLMTFFVTTAAFGCLSICKAEAPTDSLWVRAVVLWSGNDDLVPGLIKMHMQEVDKHGKIKDQDKYREVWSSLSLGEDGEVEYQMVKVVEDGEDKTEQEKAKQDEEREEEEKEDGDSESHEMEGYSPFDSKTQDRISVNLLGAGGIVGGRDTEIYEFTEVTEDDVEMSGRAWLETATGAPVRIEYTRDPLPKHVKHMVTTMEYEHPAPDSLIVSDMFVEVTGGILFFKKHFHMNMEFHDYWRLPEDYKSGSDKE
jgi:hypothetical protein